MNRWYSEKKREHFYKEAKKQGYRARSAFKLKQIQKKFNIISKSDLILDLGAAPGGWSQVAREFGGKLSVVIAIDIQKINPIEDIIIIRGDITNNLTIETINQHMKNRKADVIISDMSPDISGKYSIDQANSIWLCENAFIISKTMLKKGGNFVCKIFEGEDSNKFIAKVKKDFQLVKKFSPTASRKSSSEIYLIAKGLKG